MYEMYYGFREKPFNIAPDPDFLYPSRKHKNAISSLDYGLMEESGIILFTGEIGTGKTTIIRHMLKKIGAEFQAAVVENTNVSGNQLLGLILQEFGLELQTDNKATMIRELTRILSEMRTENKRPLLIIDEGQTLSHEALEEVRLLSNLQLGNTTLLQIMLVGQPELNAKLNTPAMAALSQRITINYHLKPFDREETGQYIAHRLKTVGGSPDLFTDAAIDTIHRTTGGIPRSINIISHAALVYGFADDHTKIDVSILEEIMKDSGNTGLGIDRWCRDGTGDTIDQNPAKSTALAPNPPPIEAAPSVTSGDDRLEKRISLLESRLAEYTKELRDFLKTSLIKERNKSDRLLAAYTSLKARFEASQGDLANGDNRSGWNAVAPGESDASGSPQRAKTISLVQDSKNKSGKE
jgi:putative secretion ATPase (PEP-CTERM system associated)